MTDSDSYLTIKNEAESEIKVKGSRFIGRVRACADENEATATLEAIRKKYYDATHNCFAYRVGLGREMKFRYSDDGEPSGTAGKPIYDQLEGRNLANTLIVITRYFGGTKLGTGGLTHAYADAAREVLDRAGIIEKLITGRIRMVVQFPDYSQIERLISQTGATTVNSDFSDIVKLEIELRLSYITMFKEKAVNLTSGRIRFEKKL